LIASKLQQIDAIRWRRSRVEIVDRGKLEPAACDCYAALRDGMDRLTRRHESHVHGQALGPSFGI
jgi:hypothetical protein